MSSLFKDTADSNIQELASPEISEAHSSCQKHNAEKSDTKMFVYFYYMFETTTAYLCKKKKCIDRIVMFLQFILWTDLQNKRRRPVTPEVHSHGTQELLQENTRNAKDCY